MALRGTEFGDWAWEYDAPQFVDFSKLSCADMINDEDYFNVDHEQRNPVSKTKAFKAVEKTEPQMAIISPGTDGKKLSIKSMEPMNVSKIKQEPDTEFRDYKTDVESKENVGESSLNLLDSPCSFSKLPDIIDSKSLKLNDVFKPPSPVGKIQAVISLEETQGENHDHGLAAPYSFGKTLEDMISSQLSNKGMEGTAHTVLCPIKTTLSVVGEEVVTACDPEPDDNEVCILKTGKTSGDRGRTMNRNCRQVDEVTSAKKRLSMSVDRGRDRLRLLSPSPPLHREGSLERKENLEHLPKSELPPANPKSHGKGICHSLVFHKSRSIVKSQTIVESQSEMTVDEREFVRGLTENNLEAVEDERLNRTGAVPHTGVPFQLFGTQRVTLPTPFSFEQRTKQMLVKKEEKIRKILETERKARVFHAQPFPDIIYSAAQPKKRAKPAPKPPTKPVPFQLHLPNPTAKPAAEPKQTFRAKPAKVLHMEPFVPQKAAQRKTGFLPPSLNTKQRAEKRAEWDRQMQEKEVQTGQERVVKERQRKEHDDQELRKLRAATVHKANPIRYYKPVAVVPSTKASTIPKSPAMSHRSNAS